LIVVLALTLLGGGIIHDFAFALLIGILVGTYSSVFVASPLLLLWQGRARRT
ncbi:MAG: protein translocase subunit SecF, partial [Deltaproteobacteria bacterium]